jgi:hypothetical protein
MPSHSNLDPPFAIEPFQAAPEHHLMCPRKAIERLRAHVAAKALRTLRHVPPDFLTQLDHDGVRRVLRLDKSAELGVEDVEGVRLLVLLARAQHVRVLLQRGLRQVPARGNPKAVYN